MTDATVAELLGGIYYGLLQFIIAVTELAAAIVGLWMLKYLVDTITHSKKKVLK